MSTHHDTPLQPLRPIDAAAVEEAVNNCWYLGVVDPHEHSLVGLDIDTHPDMDALARGGERMMLAATILSTLRQRGGAESFPLIPLTADTLAFLKLAVGDAEESVTQAGEHPDDIVLSQARLLKLRGITEMIERLLSENSAQAIESTADDAILIDLTIDYRRAIVAGVGDEQPMTTACERVVDGFTEALAVTGLGVEDRAFLLQSRREFLGLAGSRLDRCWADRG
jgi:hypothetical protein